MAASWWRPRNGDVKREMGPAQVGLLKDAIGLWASRREA